MQTFTFKKLPIHIELLKICWFLIPLIYYSANLINTFVITFKCSFVNRVGYPLMLGSVIIATVYLLIAHVIFGWHT